MPGIMMIGGLPVCFATSGGGKIDGRFGLLALSRQAPVASRVSGRRIRNRRSDRGAERRRDGGTGRRRDQLAVRVPVPPSLRLSVPPSLRPSLTPAVPLISFVP